MRLIGPVLGLIAGAICGTTALAAEPAPSDQWKIDFQVYLWGASMGGTTAAGDSIDVSFGDLVKDLDFAFMGSVGGHKGKWSALADVIYMDLSQTENSTANLIGQSINTSVEVELTGLVINLIGGYTAVQTEKSKFDVIFGARYLNLDTDLSFTIGNQFIPFSGSGDVWDGIIGVKGNYDLAEKWYFSYYLDAGTGDSDLTWQALAGLGYQLPRLDIGFGYRYIEWNFTTDEPGGKTFDDLDFHGPYAGVKFVF